jgi:hypothetical protein
MVTEAGLISPAEQSLQLLRHNSGCALPSPSKDLAQYNNGGSQRFYCFDRSIGVLWVWLAEPIQMNIFPRWLHS